MELIDKYNHKCWRYVSCDFMFKFLSARSPIYLGPVIRRQIQDSCFFYLEVYFSPQVRESGILDFGFQIPPTVGIQNPSSTDKEPGNYYLVSGILGWNPESKTLLNSVTWSDIFS